MREQLIESMDPSSSVGDIASEIILSMQEQSGNLFFADPNLARDLEMTEDVFEVLQSGLATLPKSVLPQIDEFMVNEAKFPSNKWTYNDLWNEWSTLRNKKQTTKMISLAASG